MYSQNKTISRISSEYSLANLIALVVRKAFGLTVSSKLSLSPGAPRVYFSNHTSHVDFLLVWSALPKETRDSTVAAAAADYWCKNKVRHWVASRVFDSVFIERSNIGRCNNPVAAIIKELDSGRSVIIFPEGGRTEGPEVAELKSGLFHIARKRPEYDLVPVYVHNANRVLPKGVSLPLPVMCSVTFGEPIHLLEDEDKRQFGRRARVEIEKCRVA